MERKKKTIRDFYNMKKNGEKVSWITAYDAQMARLAEKGDIDMILIGDSVGNNLLGYKSTIPVTMDEMIIFSGAVRRGAPNTFIIGDMPLGSYQASNEIAVNNAIRFIKEAEVDAVKCEGGERMYDRVKAMNDAGIAVVGHIGYTPQSTNLQGIVQSKNLGKFEYLLKDALALQKAGAWSILLEAIPNEPAGLIAKYMDIPIYGIGAGKEVDGILAIMNDVIGLGTFDCKFVENFCDANKFLGDAIGNYIGRIKSGSFPQEQHFYSIKEEELKEIREYMNKKNQEKKADKS
jgi:3-methyl-2-oxobutanoate hydroxymethyltransferase